MKRAVTKRDPEDDSDFQPKAEDFEELDSSKESGSTSSQKRAKTEKASVGVKNADGSTTFELSNDKKKRLAVRKWEGRVLVDIREYYKDKSKNDMMPGKKGISLNSDQFQFILEHANEIAQAIKALESSQ
ncbi:Transcriptional coactivator [Podila verticillata]|nr:Transcriptional coactivator [Podila verticillata]